MDNAWNYPQTINWNHRLIMEVDKTTTYQDVKEFVARSFGYKNWEEVVFSDSVDAMNVFNAAIDMVGLLRNKQPELR